MSEKLTADRIDEWCEACRDYLLAYSEVKLGDLRATFSDIFAELNEPEAIRGT